MTLRGYWSLDVLERFSDALDARLAGLPAGSPVRLLMNGSAQSVQSRELIEALQRRAVRRNGEGMRVAIVVATMLRKLQAERVSPAGNRAVFFDEGEALAWLFAAEDG